jgi:hypothetical protein
MRINYHEYYWHTTATGRLGGKLRTYLSASAFQGNPLPPPPTLWVTTGLVLDSFLEGHVKIEGNPDRNINTTYEKGIGIHLPSREFPRFVSVLQKLLDTPDIWLPTCKIEVDTNPNIKLDALVFGQFPSWSIFIPPALSLIVSFRPWPRPISQTVQRFTCQKRYTPVPGMFRLSSLSCLHSEDNYCRMTMTTLILVVLQPKSHLALLKVNRSQ